MLFLSETQAGALVKDKTIAVVGNAESLYKYNYGNWIDAHEVIIRFNKGIPLKNYFKLGRKTTILAGFRFNKTQWELANKPIFWYRGWYNSKKHHIEHRDWEGAIEWRAEKHREDRISKHLKKDRGPSNGVMLLEVLVNLFEPKSVNLFGFDFFQTKSWYPESSGKVGGGRYHDGEGEAHYIKKIIGFKLERPGVYKWKKS